MALAGVQNFEAATKPSLPATGNERPVLLPGGSRGVLGPLTLLPLPVGLSVGYQVHGGIRGRHGDRTVKGSTTFPRVHQLVGLVVVHSPHLKIHPDTVVKIKFFVDRVRVPV